MLAILARIDVAINKQAAGFVYARGYPHDPAAHERSGDDYRFVERANYGGLAVLADGLSSHARPGLASTYVVERFSTWFRTRPEVLSSGELVRAVSIRDFEAQAHAIHEELAKGIVTPMAGLAAVATAVLWSAGSDELLLVHAGDTRAFGIYVPEGAAPTTRNTAVRLLTVDHTEVVMRRRRAGERDRSGGVVQNASGVNQAFGVVDHRHDPPRGPTLRAFPVHPPPGNVLVAIALTSDGWYGSLSDDRVRSALTGAALGIDIHREVAACAPASVHHDDASLLVVRTPCTPWERARWAHGGEEACAALGPRVAWTVLAEALASLRGPSSRQATAAKALRVLAQHSVPYDRAWRAQRYEDVREGFGREFAIARAGFLLRR